MTLDALMRPEGGSEGVQMIPCTNPEIGFDKSENLLVQFDPCIYILKAHRIFLLFSPPKKKNGTNVNGKLHGIVRDGNA